MGSREQWGSGRTQGGKPWRKGRNYNWWLGYPDHKVKILKVLLQGGGKIKENTVSITNPIWARCMVHLLRKTTLKGIGDAAYEFRVQNLPPGPLLLSSSVSPAPMCNIWTKWTVQPLLPGQLLEKMNAYQGAGSHDTDGSWEIACVVLPPVVAKLPHLFSVLVLCLALFTFSSKCNSV